MNVTAKASARKSLGEYKPLISYSNGQTEVCEKSPERFDKHTKYGIVKGNRYARGNTYPTREEAILVAQTIIDMRKEDALRRVEKMSNIPGLEKGVERAKQEARRWGWEG